MKNKLLFLLIGTFIIISSLGIISAGEITEDNHLQYLDSTYASMTSETGLKFVANYNVSLIRVTTSNTTIATKAYLWNSAKGELASASISGNNATFNYYNLTEGTTYYIVVDGEESTYTRAEKCSGVTYPYNLTNINIIGGLTNGATDFLTCLESIQSITTDDTTKAVPSILVNLTSPANNSVISSSLINFSASLNITGTNLSYQWKNITYDIWWSNGTLFNSTLNNSLSGNVTNVAQNISGFDLGNYKWDTYSCYGNTTFSNCTWSYNGNFSFGVGLAVSNVTFNSTTIPTASESFILQGVKTTFTSSVSAVLVYNGTSYPSTVTISGNNVNITNSVTIPANALGNTTFYWTITSFGTLGSISQNSSTYGQVVGNLSIYACTSPPSSGLALNFTLYDESTKLKLNGSLETTFTYFAYGGSGVILKTYNFESINLSKNNWMFCINSSGNASFSGYASYYADYYDRREYIFNNATVGNFTQNIPLYLSLIADTDVVTVIVTDENYNPITNALVNVQEWNVGTNTYSTIGMFYVDSSGNGIINLELYNLWYRAIVTVNGQIVKTTDVKKLASTTWAIIVDSISADSYTLFSSISHGLVFDNVTNITTFSWVDSSGYINYGCLDIRNKTSTGYKNLSTECTTSSAGTINYQLVGNGDYEVIGTIYLLPIYNVSKVTDVKYIRLGTPALTSTVSKYGKVLSFIFIGVATGLGVAASSPIWGGILLIGSIFISGKLGWLNITESILFMLLSITIVIIIRQTRK
ncbi:MAG: hypothetical protein M0R17_09500 [Candidatus Omnitrophica bacterium]|jgi:hypothetical protein|nr:hypothetical protein [Candidatus Omnitrophota bacterium]